MAYLCTQPLWRDGYFWINLKQGTKDNYRLEIKREREREGERGREAYGFFIDADWLFRVYVEYLLNTLGILEGDKSKAPAA